ncbi:MAG: hypothetical protein PHW04_08120 [Candidatus Wallbacteria bacterium]|nr:hypothetical protein [Candidatus Wallbacteria bacterium]
MMNILIEMICALVLLFPTPGRATTEADVETVRKQFEGLAIGEDREKKQKKDWLTETLEQMYQAEQEEKWEEVIRLSEKVLDFDAGHREAKTAWTNAKQKLFWKRYGDHFIFGIIILIAAPWLFKFLQELINFKPTKDAYLSKGRDLYNDKKWQKLIDYYKKIMENPRYAEELQMKDLADINLQIGMAYTNLGKLPQATKALTETLKYDNTIDAAHTQLTRLFLKQNATHERALQEYQLYFKHFPTDMEICGILAKYYLSKELNTDDALTVYRKYLKVEPDNKDIIKLIVTRFIRKHESTKEAMELYEKFLGFFPNKQEVRRELAKIYFTFAMYEKAIECCKALIEKGFLDDEDLHKINVESHQKMGKYEELKHYYEDCKVKFSQFTRFVELANKIIGKGEETEYAEKIVQKKEEEDSNFYICPNCAHLNPIDSEYCLGCGKLIKE